jgi:hypothetical protein
MKDYVNRNTVKVGRLVARGILLECFMWFGALVLVGVLLIPFRATDDSDVGKFDRSGLKIYTDAKTGVQYVGSKHGFSIRVDRNGYPVYD